MQELLAGEEQEGLFAEQDPEEDNGEDFSFRKKSTLKIKLSSKLKDMIRQRDTMRKT